MNTQAKTEKEVDLWIDPDVKKVLEFMEANIPIRKCVEVANAVKELALPFWGRYVKPTDRYDHDYFVPIRLKRQSLRPVDMLPQSTTIE